MKNLNHLTLRFEESVAFEKQLFEKFTIPEIIQHYLDELKYAHYRIALYYLFEVKDLNQVKKHFYLIARLFEFYMKQPFDYHFVNFTDIILGTLSDEPRIIERLSFLYHPCMERSIQTGNSFAYQSLQFIIRRDWEKLNQLVEIMDTKLLPFKKNQEFLWDREVFVGFLERDKTKIEGALQQMLVPKVHKARNKHQIYPECVSFPALGYAKLAWIKGMEVEVNNPLIPRELLPVQPLAAYPEYEFILEAEAQAKTYHVK